MATESHVTVYPEGGSIHVGEAATRRVQLITLKSALKLEASGLKIRRGFSATKAAQQVTGLKTRDRDALRAKLDEMIAALESQIDFRVEETRARYIDGSHERRKLLSNALTSLCRRIEEGREFPDALESARLQWGLLDTEVTTLTAMYDAMGGK